MRLRRRDLAHAKAGRSSASSGPNQKRRTRPLATFTLSPEAVGLLEALADLHGLSKSATVEMIIRQAARTEGLKPPTARRRRR